MVTRTGYLDSGSMKFPSSFFPVSSSPVIRMTYRALPLTRSAFSLTSAWRIRAACS